MTTLHLRGPIEEGSPLTAAQHDDNMLRLFGFPTLAAMLADEDRNYDFYSTGQTVLTLAEGFRYKVAAADATDHHLTTGGGLKLYVLPGPDGFYPLKAFGAVANNSTDIYDVLWTAIYKTPEGIANIDLGLGQYYCSKTLHLKKPVYFRGLGGKPNTISMTRIRWPSGTKGIWLNHPDTYAGHSLYQFATVTALQADTTILANYNAGAWFHTIASDELFEIVDSGQDYTTAGGVKVKEIARSSLDAPDVMGRGTGSWFEEFEINGTANISSYTTLQRISPSSPHGIHSQTRFFMKNMTIKAMAGCGVFIYADTSTKIISPIIYGEASFSQLQCCLAYGNGGDGFYFRGYDQSISTYIALEAVHNGRCGVRDWSFLGNGHYGHHTSNNGIRNVANGNPTGKSGYVAYEGTRYTARPPNTTPITAELLTAAEDLLVSTTPGTNPLVWAPTPVPGGSHAQIPEWQSGQESGTYFHGCSYYVDNDNARYTFTDCYSEGACPASFFKGPGLVLGGMHGAGFCRGGSLKAANGDLVQATMFQGIQIAGLDIEGEGGSIGSGIWGAVGAAPGISDSVVSWKHPDEGGPWGVVWDDTNKQWIIRFSNSALVTPLFLTSTASTRQFGTGANVPYMLGFKEYAIGNSTDARIHRLATAAPTTDAHARGEIVWNRDPSAAGTVGWVCVTAGTPGTWKEFGTIAP